jgi:hypothetical protein
MVHLHHLSGLVSIEEFDPIRDRRLWCRKAYRRDSKRRCGWYTLIWERLFEVRGASGLVQRRSELSFMPELGQAFDVQYVQGSLQSRDDREDW